MPRTSTATVPDLVLLKVAETTIEACDTYFIIEYASNETSPTFTDAICGTRDEAVKAGYVGERRLTGTVTDMPARVVKCDLEL